MTPGLALAIREVAENPPPPMTLETHGLALRIFGEGLDQIEEQRQKQHQGEAAHPAA